MQTCCIYWGRSVQDSNTSEKEKLYYTITKKGKAIPEETAVKTLSPTYILRANFIN
jgi:hypothetical protein